MLTTIAALAFSVLAFAVTVFQVALIGGARWGELTLGGKFPGRLPLRVRFIPAVSIVLLAGFTAIVLARAGIAFHQLENSAPVLVWLVVAYCAIGVLANFFTPSRRERAVWFPVVVLMLISSVLVATSRAS